MATAPKTIADATFDVAELPVAEDGGTTFPLIGANRGTSAQATHSSRARQLTSQAEP